MLAFLFDILYNKTNMTNKLISIIIGIVIVLIIGIWVYENKKPAYVPLENDIQQTQTQTQTQNKPNSNSNIINSSTNSTITEIENRNMEPITKSIFSLEEISSHNSRVSCWSAIGGGVYDLTSWIPNHPGGEKAILSICGIDGSKAYDGKHGLNPKIAKILGGFRIGELSD